MELAVRDRRVLILYTTRYRTGGDKFARAADVLKNEKTADGFEVTCESVESKAEFLYQIENVLGRGHLITELHFIGHSGLYGVMFGTTDWPEQFSPHEWSQMKIPFAPGARAYFHACRTGRWFAPFFAREFGVNTYGHFWYTTVSKSKDRFVWEGFRKSTNPIYIVSVAGKKSHGFFGSLLKYIGKPKIFALTEFEPPSELIDRTYDSVAALYDDTFEDISVRSDELKWLRSQLLQITARTLLDIGCGTGSFLRGIEDLVESAHGVDLSQGMIEHARKRALNCGSKTRFSKIDGPRLPFADNSFDVVTSILSFRYLDWDPVVSEILRVLRPGGHLLVIDMVAKPIELKNIPRFLVDKLRHQATLLRHPHYRHALRKMVSHQSWKKMLKHNPMRAEHEYLWYFKSRFPGNDLRVINYAWNSRILALKSAPIEQKKVESLSFP
jgi:ubiquinone/menaquinone biosynthesis C-methylase UbiE